MIIAIFNISLQSVARVLSPLPQSHLLLMNRMLLMINKYVMFLFVVTFQEAQLFNYLVDVFVEGRAAFS